MTRTSASHHPHFRASIVAALSVAAAAACNHVRGDLVSIGLLDLTPDSLADSVLVGSTVPRAMTIHTSNLGGGELHWVARVLDGSPWLSLQTNSGVAGDSVLVWADPTGLAVGVYRDTIVVTSDAGGSAKISIVFRTLAPPLPPSSIAVRLAFAQQPSGVPAGTMPVVQVAARDSAGRVVLSFAGPVTLSAIPDTAPLSGTVTVSAVAGIATFSNFGLVTTGCRRLVASSPGLIPDTSAAFCITPGPAAALNFTVQPAMYPVSYSMSGAVIAPVVVSVVDAYGNIVDSATDPIHITLGNSASATLSGTTTVAAAAGVATFSDLSIDRTGSGLTLVATATGLTGATSTSFDVPVDVCWSRLQWTVQPTSATVGAIMTPPVQVCAEDEFGNVATWFVGDVTVAIASNPGGGTLTGTVTTAIVSGCATFADLSIDKAGAGYTLVASDVGLVAGASAPFDITSP